jgi:pyruvate kinase
MVARGDMGVEMDMTEVPIMQKVIIEKCFLRGKPVITATQMLESMIEKPIPTRAEASDVANACFDLTSAVMLSGETAVGKHPETVVKTMADIVKRVEEHLDYDKIFIRTHDRRKNAFRDLTTTVNGSAVAIAEECRAKAIVVVTKMGYSARMVSKLRPGRQIWAFTYDRSTYHQMALNWGIQPFIVNEEVSFETLVTKIKDMCLAMGLAEIGERIVIVGGLPMGKHGTTNMVRVETIGKRPIEGTCLNNRSATAPAVFINSTKDFHIKDISGKVVFLKDFKKQYVSHLKIVAGIVMETNLYESDLSILGIAYNIPIIISAAGAFDHVVEGSVVEINGERDVLVEV